MIDLQAKFNERYHARNSRAGEEQLLPRLNRLIELQRQRKRYEGQRDFENTFRWGHSHDFGTFQQPGVMGNRHVKLLENFQEFFPAEFLTFEKRQVVLDVGCWTGGTTLALALLNDHSHILGLEEVGQYAQIASFLAHQFKLMTNLDYEESYLHTADSRLRFETRSLYELPEIDIFQRFTAVYCPGVIYHVSDPVLALRRMFEVSADGALLFLESAHYATSESVAYVPSVAHAVGNPGSRIGWNRFIPSQAALTAWLTDAGWRGVRTRLHGSRVYAVASRYTDVPLCLAGMSCRGTR